jgi:hypothetical protein
MLAIHHYTGNDLYDAGVLVMYELKAFEKRLPRKY